MFTIVINYPTDYDGLTRWSKRLFAVHYTCGLAAATCIAAAIVGGFTGMPPGWFLGIGAFGVLLGAPGNLAASLLAHVDQRRIELHNEQLTD